jgi:glycosyltransferase involved in cell wall biosynthesis
MPKALTMPPLLDAIIPHRMRARFWRLMEVPDRLRFRRRLKNAVLSPRRGSPALNYGNALAADAGGLIYGGRVKLLHLAEVFPEAISDFNLLYLVSSAPPQFAPDLVDWAKRQGVKFVWNQNGVAYPAWYGARVDELNVPMRALRERADYIFYQSAFCQDCAQRFLGDVNTPSQIAFNCVDMARFRPVEPADTSVCRLLVAGSHHESYRVMSVLDTVAELKRRKFPVMLHLAGRFVWPGAEEEVANALRDLGIEALVQRIPPYRQEDAPAIYQAAHILLHPKYKDPCPTVPIEAMACGVPVIGSASGGMPELVGDDGGMLLEVPESWEKNYWPAPTAMADAVEVLMSKWPQFREAARARAEARFSKEHWLAQHAQVFRALAAA